MTEDFNPYKKAVNNHCIWNNKKWSQRRTKDTYLRYGITERKIDTHELAKRMSNDDEIGFYSNGELHVLSKHPLIGEIRIINQEENASQDINDYPQIRDRLEEIMTRPVNEYTTEQQVITVYKLLQKFIPVFKYTKRYYINGVFSAIRIIIKTRDIGDVVFNRTDDIDNDNTLIRDIKYILKYDRYEYIINALYDGIKKLPKNIKKLQKKHQKDQVKNAKLQQKIQRTIQKTEMILNEKIAIYCEFCGKLIDKCECDRKKC